MSIIKLTLFIMGLSVIILSCVSFIPPYIGWFIPFVGIWDMFLCIFGAVLIFTLIFVFVHLMFWWWLAE